MIYYPVESWGPNGQWSIAMDQGEDIAGEIWNLNVDFGGKIF